MVAKDFHCDCNAVNEELVNSTLKAMPRDDVFTKLAEFYKIIGNDTRCKIIFALSLNEMCVCDLANVLTMTKSSISHQLSGMRGAGVVKCRREGKEVYYSLDDEHITNIFAISLTHISHKHKEEI